MKSLLIVALITWVQSAVAATLPDEYASRGKLIFTQMVTAPFPHPERAQGHKYKDQFFSAAEHYSNSTVAIFIPKGFKPRKGADFIVHFHGWQNDVEGVLKQYHLLEQLLESGRNAILVVPQGPYRASDSFGGKLEDTNGFKHFMAEVAAALPGKLALDSRVLDRCRIILSGHSGGYHVMSSIVEHGGLSNKIKEVWLFDALYGQTEKFLAWAEREHGRLLNIYTEHGGTKEETEHLLGLLKEKRASLFSGKDEQVSADQLSKPQFVFLFTDLPHNDVLDKHQTFQQFLNASCLEKSQTE